MINPMTKGLGVGAGLIALFAVTASVQAADLGGNEFGLKDDLPPSVGRPYGIYGTIFGGVDFTDESDFDGLLGGATESVNVDFDTGYNVGGAIGGVWHSARIGGLTPRTEIEVSYSEADADTINFTGNGLGNEPIPEGSISSTKVFANLLFDINTQSNFTPYFGGGIGVAFTELDLNYSPGFNLNDDDESFAFQLIAGAAYKISDRVSLTLDGRYTRIVDVDTDRFAPDGTLAGNFEDDIDNFSINGGLRISLY